MRVSIQQLKRIIRESLILEFGAENYESGKSTYSEKAIQDIVNIVEAHCLDRGFGKSLSKASFGRVSAGIYLNKTLRKAGVYDETNTESISDIVNRVFRTERGGKYYSNSQQVMQALEENGYA